MAFTFRIDNQQFYYSPDRRLRCGTNPSVLMNGGRVSLTFEFLLSNPGKKLNFLQLWRYDTAAIQDRTAEDYVAKNKNTLEVAIGDIRRAIKTASGNSVDVMTALKTVHTFGYVWLPETIKIQATKEEKAEADRKNALELRCRDNLYTLMREAEDFLDDDNLFYKTARGTKLPFIHLNPENFGFPSFPLPIINDTCSVPDRGDKSMERLRKFIQGRRVYPGQIYRLITAAKDGWVLGRTSYVDIIEACDYYSFRIKSGWQEIFEQNGNGKRFWQNSDAIEWKEAINYIKQGDFSHYAAGMAFSIPIFQINDNGSITLLQAISSTKKQAGGGLRHVIPAGMLEFSGDWDSQKAQLNLEDFQAYAGKELIEETLLPNPAMGNHGKRLFFPVASKSKDLDLTNPETGDSTDVKMLRRMIIDNLLGQWDTLWNGEHPSKEALEKVMQMQPGTATTPWFFIVDAFCLRPEVIIPLYVKQDLGIILNWEYEEQETDRQLFMSLDGLEEWVARDYVNWVAPGIAAAYFGAKYYFENKAVITG